MLFGSPAVGEGGWEGVDDFGGFDGGVGYAFDHGDDVVAGCLNWDLKDFKDGRMGELSEPLMVMMGVF